MNTIQRIRTIRTFSGIRYNTTHKNIINATLNCRALSTLNLNKDISLSEYVKDMKKNDDQNIKFLFPKFADEINNLTVKIDESKKLEDLVKSRNFIIAKAIHEKYKEITEQLSKIKHAASILKFYVNTLLTSYVITVTILLIMLNVSIWML